MTRRLAAFAAVFAIASPPALAQDGVVSTTVTLRDAEGQGVIQIFATDVTLAIGLDGSLRDQDGTAIVIHAGPDDYKTDPAGDSGGRIACGVVD